jgi:catechol 2,3-dioxygenase-like lactoylglutathione lyase family enzyme
LDKPAEIKLDHVAVAANSEEQADRFFVELLGLKRTRTASVPADMMNALFNTDLERETPMLRYAGDGLDFEVFITGDDSKALDPFTHCCLVVSDRDRFCQRARSMGLDVIRVPKPSGDAFVVFVTDFHGNRYEIK